MKFGLGIRVIADQVGDCSYGVPYVKNIQKIMIFMDIML